MINARRPAGQSPKSGRPDPLADAVRYLARGDRSAIQVERHLAGREYSKAAIRKTLRALKRLGYVNDEAVALRMAKARLARRAMAREALAAELAARGFSFEAVTYAVRGAYTGLTNEAIAAEFLASLPRRYEEPERERRRRAGLLRGRGFVSEVGETVLGGGLGGRVTYADGE